MALTSEITTIYNSTFIPFDLYLVIFMGTLMFLGASIIIKRDCRIFLAAIAMLLSFFSTYATFVLGRTEAINLIEVTGESTSTFHYEVLNVVYTVEPLLFLCIGITAIAVFNLWMCVWYRSEKTLIDAHLENKDIKSPAIKPLKPKKEDD